MSRTNRVAITLTDKEKGIFQRNAAIYASANGLDKVDTSEAVRHFFLSMDAIEMLTGGSTKRPGKGSNGKGLTITLHPDLAITFKRASDSTGQPVEALVNTTLFQSLEQTEGVSP